MIDELIACVFIFRIIHNTIYRIVQLVQPVERLSESDYRRHARRLRANLESTPNSKTNYLNVLSVMYCLKITKHTHWSGFYCKDACTSDTRRKHTQDERGRTRKRENVLKQHQGASFTTCLYGYTCEMNLIILLEMQ